MISVRRPRPPRRPSSWRGSTSPTRATSPRRPAAPHSPGWGSSFRLPRPTRLPPGAPDFSHGRPGNLSLKLRLRSVKVSKWAGNLWENSRGASTPILSLHWQTLRLKTEKDNSTGERDLRLFSGRKVEIFIFFLFQILLYTGSEKQQKVGDFI